jgi:hypothetical protein
MELEDEEWWDFQFAIARNITGSMTPELKSLKVRDNEFDLPFTYDEHSVCHPAIGTTSRPCRDLPY